MSFRVYDPHAFTYVTLDEATYGRAVGDYVPVRSITGRWFAVYFPTNQSHKFEAIALPAVRQLLEREVRCVELTEAMLAACASVREGLVEPVVKESTTTPWAEHGMMPYTVAKARARKAGYTHEEVERAMTVVLNGVKDKLDESVEVVRFSRLVEGA
jgi:hypothetical protein